MRFSLFLLVVLCAPLLAATVGWRMDGTSLFPAAAPQTQWGVNDRVVWATELPKWSNASPVLVGDRIFVCAEPSTLICLDRAGAILWQRTNTYEELLSPDELVRLTADREAVNAMQPELNAARQAVNEKRGLLRKAEEELKANPQDTERQAAVAGLKAELKTLEDRLAELTRVYNGHTLTAQYRMPSSDAANGYSSNTPVADGRHVYVAFGTGVVACYTLDGELRWRRFVEKPTHDWGHSCSPVLVGDTLVIQYLDMHALDALTGETRWRTKHPHIWGTPAPVTIGQYAALFTDCSEIVNVADGKTLAATGMKLEFNSPLVIGSTAYCVSGRLARAYALAAGDNGKVTATRLWETPVNNDRYYASPLLHDGLLYVVNQKGVLSVLDAATGEKAYEQRLERMAGTFYSSPVLAGNVIILANESGKCLVIAAGREYRELSRPVFEPFRCTPVCDGARMYIRTCTPRTPSRLYCIGE